MNRILGMRQCVAKYFAFKDEVQRQKVELPEYGAGVTFILPMPKGWSQKKKKELYLRPHRQTPDLSNLLKALEDALFDDDSHIWHYKYLQKLWGYEGAIEIKTGEQNEGYND
jgi:Holliday junction resolvase RusA-like endonuclease